MSKAIDAVGAFLVNLICNHTEIAVGLLALFVLATLVNSGIKGTWSYVEMPRWARFILSFTMPIALNFYHVGEKVGIQTPKNMDSLPTDAANEAKP